MLERDAAHLLGRRGASVLRAGRRLIERPAAQRGQTQNETLLLVVEKEVLIEAANRLEVSPRHDEARALDRTTAAGHRLRVTFPINARRPPPLSSRKQPDEVQPRRWHPLARPQPTVAVKESRPDDRVGAGSTPLEEPRQRVAAQTNIRVDEGNERAPRGAPSEIAPRPEPQIARAAHDHGLRTQRLGHLHATILRRVVDDDHLGQRRDRAQAFGQYVGRVEQHDHNGKATQRLRCRLGFKLGGGHVETRLQSKITGGAPHDATRPGWPGSRQRGRR